MRQTTLTAARAAIRQVAPQHPVIQAVYLFGSLVQVGRFTSHSDIDVAIQCDRADDCVSIESNFWRQLEETLAWNVDVRPYTPPLIQEIADYGECVYARKSYDSGAKHPVRQIR